MAEEEQPRKKVNCYFINLIPRPICDVEFKVLPFYRNIHKMFEPVALYCTPTANSVLKQPQEHTQCRLPFKLPELIVKMIEEKSKSVQLQIRFGKELKGMSELSEGLPGPIQMSINSHRVFAKNSPINYNCNICVLSGEAENVITLIWPHYKIPYYMTVTIVESITIEDLVKRVQFNNKLGSVTLNTKAKVIEFLKSDAKNSDVELCDLPTLKLSLLCPITKLKMKLPTRSLKCSHLQCFDLHALFSMNKISPKWKCPVCNIPILIHQLVVDLFLLDIMKSSSLPENCFQIIFYDNGNWEPYIEPKKEYYEDDQSESDNEHPENITSTVNLGNGHNDENVHDEKNILPKTNDWNCDGSEPMMIDLTVENMDIEWY